MNSKKSRQGLILFLVLALVIGLVIGVLIGYFGKPASQEAKLLQSLLQDEDETIRDKLFDEIKPENIREYLRELTQRPHLAGTPADLGQAERLKQFWDDNGFDRTALYPYNVMLSYPRENQPNKVVLYDENEVPVFTSQLYEKILRPDQNQSDVVPPFNAYSGSGTPKGDMVYVNFGRIEDFVWITKDAGVNVADKICIVKYGKIFRGDKARHAEQFGCAGLIMYTDPKDYTLNNDRNYTYPDSWFLPSTGVQRGTLELNMGDPLTEGYPSIDSAYRIKEEDANIPKIPVHPIGYGDAENLLRHLAGDDAPEDWQGGLPFTYKLGPGFTNPEWKVQLFVHTHGENKTTYNVMGFIEGAIEPDRYVLLGNHRDAWVFGSIDPSSGTAAMMELSRAFGNLRKQGWRPRRTIVFCSWAAEEVGLIGSHEWVEHFGKLLAERTVAYLNVDLVMLGNFTMDARSLPMLKPALLDATRVVKNPRPSEIEAGRPTVYDTWAAAFPEKDTNGNPTGLPKMKTLGSGSDFAPFITRLGVSCVDMWYVWDPYTFPDLSFYPLYHTVYETFHLVDEFYDPTYAYHKAVAEVWGELARHLSESLILPFDVREYAKSIRSYIDTVKTEYGSLLDHHDTSTARRYLHEASQKFINAADAFHERLQNVDKMNPFEIRRYNDQMMNLERVFIDPIGLPNRKNFRHIVFAPSDHDSYAGSSFPGLTDSLYALQMSENEQDTTSNAEMVKQQLAIITFFTEAAAASLEDFINF